MRLKKVFLCASNATILGNVSIGEGSSVWYNAVIRSEEETIEIGQETNIQDQCVLHTDCGYPLKLVIVSRLVMGLLCMVVRLRMRCLLVWVLLS